MPEAADFHRVPLAAQPSPGDAISNDRLVVSRLLAVSFAFAMMVVISAVAVMVVISAFVMIVVISAVMAANAADNQAR